jgi:EpsI family protein
MRVPGSTLRVVLLSGCLMTSAWYLSHATTFEQIPVRAPLAELPRQLAAWQGGRDEDLDSKLLAVLGVDDYVNRFYRTGSGKTVGLYVGFYKSQREGESMHSPLNCLPGAGWLPTSTGRLRVQVHTSNETVAGDPLQAIEVNRYLVQKGGEAMLVLYWYQSHGRVIASEYWGKVYTVLDAVRLNRTDAALVRVIVPIDAAESGSEKQAEQLGVDFVQTVFPHLSRYLPV